MSWIQTYTGKRFDVLDPKPHMIDIVDIGHSLSMLCRFNGHVKKFYSVAEHSWYVSRLAPKGYKLCGLLHDASEAFIGDVTSPLKPHLENYHEIEDNLMQVLSRTLGFVYPLPEFIHKCDKAQLVAEAVTLLPHTPEWIVEYMTDLKGFEPQVMNQGKAQYTFLNSYKLLREKGEQ